jgi:hypothetical protein
MIRPQKSLHGGNRQAYETASSEQSLPPKTHAVPTCSLCQTAEGTSRRRTTKGNIYHACQPCEAKLDLMPIAHLLTFLDHIDDAAKPRQAVAR